MIRDAGFPALKIGGQWRFPREEVELWLTGHGRVMETEARESRPMETHSEVTKSTTLAPSELLSSIEITSLLKAFSSTVELSIVVVSMEGEPLVNCPGYQHPFCRLVHGIDPAQDMCLAMRQLQLNLKHAHDSRLLFDCLPGLHYLQTPIWIEQFQVGYLVMGPLVTDDSDPDLVRQGLESLARQYDANSDVLLNQFHTVKRFSNDQVRILTDLY